MWESIGYVFNEHKNNIYRIKSISKYEIKAEHNDSRLGALWNVLNPLINILTYWFVFGIGIRNNEPVDGIPFLQWMLAGLIVWFFMSACIRKNTKAISSKLNMLGKMKFPISILPATVVLSELFQHAIMIGITYLLMMMQGYIPNIYNIQILYYLFCAVVFSISFGLVFSVLSILITDIRKFILATLRLLMYVTPILWTMDNLPLWLQEVMRWNPIYYVVEGYRTSFFSGQFVPLDISSTIVFWTITTTLFVNGCILMRKYRHKFIDLG